MVTSHEPLLLYRLQVQVVQIYAQVCFLKTDRDRRTANGISINTWYTELAGS
jgi:hypothetical protein